MKSGFMLGVLAICVLGCASRFERDVVRLGFDSRVIAGSTFKHRILNVVDRGEREAAMESEPTAPLIVLIDGDGRAFLDRTTVARDPTPTRSWMLGAASELSRFGPVLYLGRPCYHLGQPDPACHPRHWTLARYGEAVVQSLEQVLRTQLPANQDAVLVGYSGGGVLAVLLADRLASRVRGVVTLGAPLDVAGWARFHGYSRLNQSLDPADDQARFQALCQRHVFGERDAEVPPELVAKWRWQDQPHVRFVATNHHCCWDQSVQEAVAEVLTRC